MNKKGKKKMAKVIFEFDYYEDGDLIDEHKNCVSTKAAIQDFDNWLRSIVKHGEEKDQILDADDVRTKLYECFNSNGVTIWS
jgi:hypothetical protein